MDNKEIMQRPEGVAAFNCPYLPCDDISIAIHNTTTMIMYMYCWIASLASLVHLLNQIRLVRKNTRSNTCTILLTNVP